MTSSLATYAFGKYIDEEACNTAIRATINVLIRR